MGAPSGGEQRLCDSETVALLHIDSIIPLIISGLLHRVKYRQPLTYRPIFFEFI